jgi:hypothetical protein
MRRLAAISRKAAQQNMLKSQALLASSPNIQGNYHGNQAEEKKPPSGVWP